MQRGGVIDVRFGGFGKRIGDLSLGFTQDNARLTLTLGLRLAGHGIFQVLRDDYIPDLHRTHGNTPGRGVTHGNTPGRGALVNDALQLGIDGTAPNEDVCQHHAADDIAQGCLSGPGNGRIVIGDFQCSLLGVPYHPEKHGIHVDWYGILSQCFFGGERRYIHAMVDPGGG